MLKRYRDWLGALSVLVITVALVALDVSDRSISRYWARHSFTNSVLSGVLVLLLTVLIVDRVVSIRQLRNQSRAIGAQAAVIVAQARRAADAIKRSPPSEEDSGVAPDELSTYMQMLLTSAPVLIEATTSRTFLETAQRAAAEMYRALRGAGQGDADRTKARVDKAVDQLNQAAAPLLKSLSTAQQAAAASDSTDA